MVTLRLTDPPTFRGGDIISGQCFDFNQYSSIYVLFTCELHQYWTTSSVDDSRTHHHEKTTVISKMMIPVDSSTGKFQFQLHPGAIPSFAGRFYLDAELRYYLNAVVDGDLKNKSANVSFEVISFIPTKHWLANTSRAEEFEDILQCCCCQRGKIKIRLFASKTTVALDRDKLAASLEIDNTESDDDVLTAEVSLRATLTFHVGHQVQAVSTFCRKTVAVYAEKGSKKTVDIEIDLTKDRCNGRNSLLPSFSNQVVDVHYQLRADVVMSFASSAVAIINDIQVAHGVFNDNNDEEGHDSQLAKIDYQKAWKTSSFYNPSSEHDPIVYTPAQLGSYT